MDPNRAQSTATPSANVEQPLGAFARCRAAGGRLLYEQPFAVLVVLLLTAAAAIIWHTSYRQSILVKAQALQSAEQMANALAEFRAIYTSEVVERVRQQGITITHDYEEREGAIPLPATLSKMLGNQIGLGGSGTQTRLYSAFPFPWRRADGGLTDDFAEDAWESLTKRPDTPFYRLEELGGIPVLRYATADLMRTACLACHNSHPDSPKTDWKVGDVRGVLEVNVPLGVPLTESRSGLMGTAVLMTLMTLGGLIVIGIVLGHLRRAVTEAQDLAKQTQETNRALETEVTERQRAEEARRVSEARLIGILDIAWEAIISVDDRQRVLLFNQGAEVTFGYSADEVLGQSLDMLLPSRFREGHRKKVEAFARGPGASRKMRERGALIGLRKDGTEFPVEASVSKLERGGETVFTVILHDITERKRAEESLLAARKSAEVANRAKSEFLASMSHELRTPLSSILGFSEIIKNETFGPVGSAQYRDYAGDINESGQHLLDLINDILDLSKVESGMDKVNEEDIEVPEILRAVQVLVKERASRGDVCLAFEYPDGLPVLRADVRKLKQILVNLLSNAIKFSPAGGAVTLKIWSGAESGHVFQITDTGIGIAPDDIPKALSQFGQVDGVLNRRHDGTGLGLPLTKALVELQGGSLDLESTVNVGTTVTVRFPVERIVTSQDRSDSLNFGGKAAS